MSELLFDPILKGPLKTSVLSSSNQWMGRTTLVSGSNTVTVSTASVNSDSVIIVTAQSATRCLSGFGMAVEVGSISPENHFILTWADIQNKPARDTTVMWMILKGS